MTERSGLDQAAVYIILLNWNSAADTLRCLRALTLLRGVQARVMVVDNGSEPADLERLRSGIARWGLAVELVETGANLGFGGGCNVGMRLALERPERVQTWGGGGILHTLNQCRWDV